MIKNLLLIVFLMSPTLTYANEPWVLKYGSWSNWGPIGDVWMNSNGDLVVSDGGNYKNIPCQSKAEDAESSRVNNLIQKLIVAKPKSSNNDESKNCSDETRVSINISLTPEISKKHGESQPLLREQFSTIYDCNENKVDLKWMNLVEELELIRQKKLKSCTNSPFN